MNTVARDLPTLRLMLLRSKRELKGEAEDDIRDESLPEPSDLITGEDVFPEDGPDHGTDAGGEDDGDEVGGFLPRLPGPLIAAATFVPTFLAVFFGVSYWLGSATPTTARTASAPSATARTPDPARPLSEGLRDPRLLDPLATRPSDRTEMTRPSDPREVVRAPSPEAATPSVAEPTAPPPVPTLPPAQPRLTTPPAPEPRALRTEPPRQPQAAVLTTTPTAEARKSERDWTPAAAFADREAAGRLASSIQQQGYPVEIRQEQGSTRPWVVWIGAQPRAGERRR